MLPLLRRPLLKVPLLATKRAFSVSSIQRDSVIALVNQNLEKYAKDLRDSENDRRWCGNFPVNRPPTRITASSPEVDGVSYTGHTSLPNGDPIGFATDAKGMDEDEAYWFGVMGVQHYAEHHESDEMGWHNDLDGFLRTDEIGPHFDFENGAWYHDKYHPNGSVTKEYVLEWEAPKGSWFEHKPAYVGCMMAAEGRTYNGGTVPPGPRPVKNN